MGVIDPKNFAPFPKNPVIARFFKEIGRVDELGSGVRNVFKYTPAYTPGTAPEFIEEDVFKTIIPLKAKDEPKGKLVLSWEELRDRLGDRLGDNEWKILEKIWRNPNISITEMARQVGISTTAIENNINKLKAKGIIKRIGSTKKGSWEIVTFTFL